MSKNKPDSKSTQSTEGQQRAQSQIVKRKLGQGAVGAAFRQGFSELTNALKAFPDSLPLIEQPGQLNNVPPSGVSQKAGYWLGFGSNQHEQATSHENSVQKQDKQVEQVTSHGKDAKSSKGFLSKLIDDITANRPAPEMNQELSK